MTSVIGKSSGQKKSTIPFTHYSKNLLRKLCPIKGFLFRTVEMTESPKKLIKVTIEPRKNNRAKCSCCGKSGPTYDTSPSVRSFEYIPLWS